MLEEYLAQNQWRDWETMIRQLPIESGQTVFDLGCGPGLISARLAPHCSRVIGIDQEATFLDVARQHCPPNCEFVNANLTTLDASTLIPANGVWSSFTAAYFPSFSSVLERWVSCVTPGGWLAIVEVDDLLTGHNPLPADIKDTIKEFMNHARSIEQYDFCMGHRLGNICRTIGLQIISEHSWRDPELAFDGIATPAIQEAWSRRFDRMQGMKTYLGADRFQEISNAFLETISSSEHYSTSSIKMVLAKRPE